MTWTSLLGLALICISGISVLWPETAIPILYIKVINLTFMILFSCSYLSVTLLNIHDYFFLLNVLGRICYSFLTIYDICTIASRVCKLLRRQKRDLFLYITVNTLCKPEDNLKFDYLENTLAYFKQK